MKNLCPPPPSLESYRKEDFVAQCEEELKTYASNYPSVEMVLLATPDGFEISSYTTNKAHNANKLSAVGSSLLALSNSLVNELKLKSCKSVVLDAEKGKIYISSIKNMHHMIVLMIQATETSSLGNIVYGAEKLNFAISTHLKKLD